MRIIHSIIFVYILSISIHNSSCSFVGDVIRQGIHTAAGVIKYIPKLILSPSEVFEIAKNIMIGLPLELTFGVFHEVCKYSHIFSLSLTTKSNPLHSSFLMENKC